jgi:ribosomal-protein-alanine N-acetyltransferase
VFFRSQSFRARRVLRNYYEDNGEDAFLMEFQLTEAEAVSAQTTNRIKSYEDD